MAAYILYLSRDKKNNSTPALDISKNQLAGILGTIPETVSRILARMRKEKLITTNGRQIQAMDIRGLEELAGGTRRLA
jgi:CRP/FNR family transcriptional regulator